MHETADDLDALQRLLDQSYAAAGPHLREVITPDRCLDANDVVARLQGMRLLVLATVTGDGRPICGPVDGIFYRGAFHFGSSPDAVRFRHISHRPQVSATHLPGEELQITVHGRAELIDMASPDCAPFRQLLLDIYVPRYGSEWAEMLDGGAVYARINARRMFTFQLRPDELAPLPDEG